MSVRRLTGGPPGIERFILGGDRAEKVDGKIVYAKQNIVRNIEESCRSGAGYIHFNTDGVVYWSKTYLADAVRVGTAHAGRELLSLEECGPVVIRRPKDWRKPRELWDERGVQLLAGSEDFWSVYFTTRREGRAVRAPDQLLVTTDGGSTFSETTNQPYPASPEEWLRGVHYRGHEDYVEGPAADELQAAWLHRAMSSEVAATMDGIRLTDGTWMRSLDQSGPPRHRLVSLRRPDGTVIDRRLPACELLPFKARLLAYCEDEKPAFRSVYPEERTLDDPLHTLRELIVDSSAGLLFAECRDCLPDKPPLLWFDGSRWQQWPSFGGSLTAVRHGRMLYCARDCVIRSTTDPTAPAIDLAPFTKPYGYTTDATLLDDEVIVLVKQRGSDGSEGKVTLLHLAFAARGLEATRVYDVPTSISRLAFADSEHGAARFDFLAGFTMDGGRTWRYEETVRSTGNVACWNEGCAVGNSLLLTKLPLHEPIAFGEYDPNDDGSAKGSSTKSDTRTDADAQEEDESSESTPETLDLRSIATYSCNTHRRTVLSRQSSVATGGYFTQTPETGALGWHGTDALGAFEVKTNYVPPEEPEPEPEEPVWMKRDVGSFDSSIPPIVARHYAVTTTWDRKLVSLLIVREDGKATALASDRIILPTSVLLPDGKGLVVAERGPYASVFLIDQYGAVIAQRWLLGGSAMPALGPEGPGVVLAASKGVREYYSLVNGSKSRKMPTFPIHGALSSVPVCSTPRDPEATFVYSKTPFVSFRDPSIPASKAKIGPGLMQLEVTAAQTCLRGAVTYMDAYASLTANHGKLEGTATDTKGTTRIVCQNDATLPEKASRALR